MTDTILAGWSTGRVERNRLRRIVRSMAALTRKAEKERGETRVWG